MAVGLDVVGTRWHGHLHGSRRSHHGVVVVVMETDSRMLRWREDGAGDHFRSSLNFVQESRSTLTGAGKRKRKRIRMTCKCKGYKS